MKAIALIVLGAGLASANLAFFLLLAVGSASMAVADGVAGDWTTPLILLWAAYIAPYAGIIAALLIRWKDEKMAKAISIASLPSTLVSFIGIIAAFFGMGWIELSTLAAFPITQSVVAYAAYRITYSWHC